MTVARQKPTLAKKMFSAFHVFGFGVPFLIVFLALEEDVLGNDRDIYSSAWCWIKVQDEGESNAKIIFWILMTDKLWEVIMFILVIVFYGLLKCHIRREVILYLVILYVCTVMNFYSSLKCHIRRELGNFVCLYLLPVL